MHSYLTRYWLNLALYTLCLLLIGALVALVYFSNLGAMTYLHPPRFQRLPDDTLTHLSVTYQDTTLLTQDGIALKAWYTPSQNGAVILFAHGYGGVRSAEMHAFLARHGYGVISWDARAHGESGGDLCTWGHYEVRDVDAALDFALGQPGVKRVGALGQSMGAATLIKAAARRAEIEAVVADSSFAALDDMIGRAIPFPVMRPIIRFIIERETGLTSRDVRPADDMARISPRPVLIIQGAQDTTVPRDSAQRLYEAAREPRTVWIVPGAEHVSAFKAAPDEYAQRVFAFLDAALLK